jgi:FG-GAP-like repeat
MQRGFLVTGLVIVASGIALGLAAPLGNRSSRGQNNVATGSPAFEADVATHETRIESPTEPELPSVTEASAQAQIEIPAPTRSTFMASWPSVKGALGYLLDVSTNDSFMSYVDGYHDLDVGNATARVVTGLGRGTTYYYRVRPYKATGPSAFSGVMRTTTEATTGLNINPTFDSSITGNPNAAAIEAMINRSISFHESLFSDPITIQIRFRYSTAGPDGTPLPAGAIAQSVFVVYLIPWSTYIGALIADARTSNDNLANASLPATALSPNIKPRSADGRAVGLDTPPAMFADGTIGPGGPYDGIVTLNSSAPYQFTRPPSAGNLDAQRSTEHEVDEVIGLGSRLGYAGNDLHPQDLFSWSLPGVRNISSSGTRYFSINGGATNIVNFNQNPDGDFGDWWSEACPQSHPYVQNAFGCTGQSADIAATSPEGINLDVVGYDLVNALEGAGSSRAAVGDFNNDSHPDYVLHNVSTRQTAIWYLNNNVYIGSAYGPTVTAGWGLRGVADFSGDTHPDYALLNSATAQTGLWYLSGPTFIGSAYGPTLPIGWELVATGDFNGDNKPDYVLYNSSTHQTAVWYLNNNVYIGGGFGLTLPGGWILVGVADFDSDGHADYLLFHPSSGYTAIAYLSGLTLVGAAWGPTVPANWILVATADFNGDSKPDYLLYNSGTRQTAVWYLNNNVFVSGAFGPTISAGWSLTAP